MSQPHKYAITLKIYADSEEEAREQLRMLCDSIAFDNDDYEWNTAIVNDDTKEKVSIYSPDYPEHMRQNKEG